MLEFRYFLKVDIESLCFMFKGSEFQSLIVAGRKELKKRFVLACNVCMSFALRRLLGLFSCTRAGNNPDKKIWS